MLEQFGDNFLQIAVWVAYIGIAFSILLIVIRAVIGPTNPDRATALDAIGINMMALVGITAIDLQTNKLNDVVLVIGILLFIGTIAIAKFLEKGVIIDRNSD
ncbi:monovalent cation/H+ antiporter complex subunit F [Halalkalibacillus halophilus]|uniref:monovalent cation/H+ antiporter complex subunit F n=1 Tax=Halalkalibacillus halophilus TaxID=392827 RepID=UPI000407195F|nr:monovalent cation/H+ antiporter complex subunit F [Halalkalibacillus halophilus]